MNRTITCNEARELIDCKTQLAAAEVRALKLHLADCPDCSAALVLEASLRRVIAPEIRPSPSVGFEAMLAAQLGIEASPVYAPELRPEAPFNPKTYWLWAIAAVAMVGLAATQLSKIFSVASDAPSLGFRAIGWLASHLTGEAAILFHTFSKVDLTGNMLLISMLLGSAVLAASLWSARSIWIEEY